MVLLTIKNNDEKIFTYEVTLNTQVEKVLTEVVRLKNGVEKINRLAESVQDLITYGVSWPPERRGLLVEQAQELRLDPNLDLSSRYPLRNGLKFSSNPDPLLKRSGLSISDSESCRVLLESTTAAKNLSKSDPLKWEHIKNGLDIMKGALNIVFPKGIPLFDPVRMELDNREEVESSNLWDPTVYGLWFTSKCLEDSEPLYKYLGKNEKSKCIIKVSKRGQGPPPKEKPFSDEEEKKLLLEQYKRSEVLKKLAKQEDESSSAWADNDELKKKFTGLEHISWKTGFY
ncbi:LOW QUALITY PROTEIN: cilia- and flagella-associated protein 298-A-like [Lepeophtheirus salmonis]|uniref:LOW QUALITY PROTEIN: cilia- and flagella-associated protein 298-A-like n=1 Tax=Lepeophtheirus salmonis TaxID=72036 RepID=UPI001AE6523E|nr:LOW QUALITY PROTEIN: cilia- and flagella-associated protein 298-A-like [Lepeophtheirus salmonis]